MIDFSDLHKPVENYYGYEFNECGACLNKTEAIRIVFKSDMGIIVSFFRNKTGRYKYYITYQLGGDGGWGGCAGESERDYFSQNEAVIAAMKYIKEYISDKYYESSFKRKWRPTIIKRLNNEIRKLTQPKQMSIFDYTTKTLNFKQL